MRFTSLFPFLLSLATAVSAAEIGGTFPWRTLQAEEAETNAERLKPSRRAGDFAAECVGKSGVRLNRAGDYVEFTAPAAANSIVVRYAIPDAPRGGGEEHTLSGYVDGKHRFDLKLSSRHTWLYGKEHDPVNDPEELKRLPGTVARRFFDEARLLTGPIPAGAKIRLQKDASDTARYYVIDLIDLEEVPPPIPRPENSLSVKEFGAVGDELFDDSDAIARCLDAAAKQKKTVYLPPGVYRTSRRFAIDEIAIQGAGMWYTTILNRRDNLAEKSNGIGFQVNGRSTLRDFAIHGDGTRRGEESHPLRGDWGKGSLVENLWIEQAECGVWVGRDNQPGPEELTVRNCRFRNLLADGINLCAGTQNSVVENCHARGTGDDSFAIWAAPKGRLASSNNVIRNCTAEAPWRALLRHLRRQQQPGGELRGARHAHQRRSHRDHRIRLLAAGRHHRVPEHPAGAVRRLVLERSALRHDRPAGGKTGLSRRSALRKHHRDRQRQRRHHRHLGRKKRAENYLPECRI